MLEFLSGSILATCSSTQCNKKQSFIVKSCRRLSVRFD